MTRTQIANATRASELKFLSLKSLLRVGGYTWLKSLLRVDKESAEKHVKTMIRVFEHFGMHSSADELRLKSEIIEKKRASKNR